MEWRKKITWARVYTLDDGSKWTIDSLVKELTKRFPTKFIQKPMVVQRLRKHTSLDKIFAEPMDTKPSTKKVPQMAQTAEVLARAPKVSQCSLPSACTESTWL